MIDRFCINCAYYLLNGRAADMLPDRCTKFAKYEVVRGHLDLQTTSSCACSRRKTGWWSHLWGFETCGPEAKYYLPKDSLRANTLTQPCDE